MDQFARSLKYSVDRAMDRMKVIDACEKRPGGHRWSEPVKTTRDDRYRLKSGKLVGRVKVQWEKKCLDCNLGASRPTKAELQAEVK